METSTSKTPRNPRYEMIKDAAQLLFQEITQISDDTDSKIDANGNTDIKKKKINRDKNNDDLELEILYLRHSLEYFYSKGVFPFGLQETILDFISTRLIMPVAKFSEATERYKENYKKRVFKICKKLEPLKSIREQDAFELGTRIWGTLSFEFLKRRNALPGQQGDYEEEDEEELDMLMDYVSSDDDDDDEDEDDYSARILKGLLKEYPVLKRASISYGVELPEVMRNEIWKEKMKYLGKNWKARQIETLRKFNVKINSMGKQAKEVLGELKKSLEK